MEADDDVLFADLSKQIALLIMEDDEEFPVQRPSSVPVQSFPYVHQAMMAPPLAYELACRRESKGTGVFIPRSSCPRRKNKSGRTPTINRQPDKSAVAVSHSTTTYNHRSQSNNVYYSSSGGVTKSYP